MSLPKVASAGRTILSSTISKSFAQEIVQGCETVKNNVKPNGKKPYLVGFLANNDPAAESYATWTQKTCEEMGFEYSLRRIPNKDFLEEKIIEANNDDEVDGIMIYFPVFGDAQDQYLKEVIKMEKDVEGLNHNYYQNMYHNIRYLDQEKTSKSILPCTPLAIIKILEFLKVYNSLLPLGNRLYGKKAIIINRSEIVGRPLAALMANDGCIVYSVDVNNIQKFTRGEGLKFSKHQVEDLGANTPELLKQLSLDADIVITGVPAASYKFPTENIKEGAVCINFSFHKNFAEDVKTKASLYVPSTGKVTICMLLRNMLRLIENTYHKKAITTTEDQ